MITFKYCFLIQARHTKSKKSGSIACDGTIFIYYFQFPQIFQVSVDKKPKAPVFKKRLPATTNVVEGQNAEFQVNIEGHPKPTLQWQFKGKLN